MARKQSPAPCHGQPGLETSLITTCVSIPALFQRAKEMVCLTESKFRNLGNSSKWNHHYLPSLSIMLHLILNETAKIVYFIEKTDILQLANYGLIVLILIIKFFSSVKTYFVSPFPLIADLRVVLGTRESSEFCHGLHTEGCSSSRS